MSHEHIIAREGWPYILASLLASLLFYAFSFKYAAVFMIIIALFIVYFFRNPERKPVGDSFTILAPADGRVMAIETVLEEKHLKEEAIKVSIFLSLFNVHINRSPAEGMVDWTHREGYSFLPAYKKDAADTNVRNYLALTTEWGKLMVVQITGLVARRLVCWVEPGDSLNAGSRFGLIKFGSCTEIYVPKDTSISVQIGQRVRGGETVIGRFDNQAMR